MGIITNHCNQFDAIDSGATMIAVIEERESVAEAFVQAVAYSGSKSVFNISSGSGTSLNELISILEEILNKPIEPHYLPSRPFDVPVSVLSNDLAGVELHWSPSISMREGIERTAVWMKGELARMVR